MHTKYLGLLTHSPYVQAALPGTNPLTPPAALQPARSAHLL